MLPVRTACPAATRNEPHHGHRIAVLSSHASPQESHPLSWLPPTKSPILTRLCLPTQFLPSNTSTTTSRLSPSSGLALLAVAAVTIMAHATANNSCILNVTATLSNVQQLWGAKTCRSSRFLYCALAHSVFKDFILIGGRRPGAGAHIVLSPPIAIPTRLELH